MAQAHDAGPRMDMNDEVKRTLRQVGDAEEEHLLRNRVVSLSSP